MKNIMVAINLLILFLFSPSLLAINFKRNDLGFIYPLNLSSDSYVKIKEILPKDILKRLSQKFQYQLDRTYLVGIKAAPCFKAIGSNQCQSQLRLVFQGSFDINPFKEKATILFNDDAVHAFFNLPKNELMNFLLKLAKLNTKNQQWIHRQLQSSAEAKNFKQQLITLLHKSQISLVTSMEGDNAFKWTFFKVYPLEEQQSILTLTEVTEEDASVLGLNEASCLTTGNRNCDQDQVRAIVTKILKIEDARKTHVDSVDCASCHAAGIVKSYMRVSTIKLESQMTDDLLKAKYLENFIKSKDTGPSNVRQLGYFGFTATVSKRTISEIDDQLLFLNKNN